MSNDERSSKKEDRRSVGAWSVRAWSVKASKTMALGSQRLVTLWSFLICHSSFLLHAQTLNLPPRRLGAPTGTQFVKIISLMSLAERENWICAQVLSGNVPNFLRVLVPVHISANLG